MHCQADSIHGLLARVGEDASCLFARASAGAARRRSFSHVSHHSAREYGPAERDDAFGFTTVAGNKLVRACPRPVKESRRPSTTTCCTGDGDGYLLLCATPGPSPCASAYLYIALGFVHMDAPESPAPAEMRQGDGYAIDAKQVENRAYARTTSTFQVDLCRLYIGHCFWSWDGDLDGNEWSNVGATN